MAVATRTTSGSLAVDVMSKPFGGVMPEGQVSDWRAHSHRSPGVIPMPKAAPDRMEFTRFTSGHTGAKSVNPCFGQLVATHLVSGQGSCPEGLQVSPYIVSVSVPTLIGASVPRARGTCGLFTDVSPT